MHLNVVKAITESSAVSLGFWRKPSDTDMQTTLAVSGSNSRHVLDKKSWSLYVIWMIALTTNK